MHKLLCTNLSESQGNCGLFLTAVWPHISIEGMNQPHCHIYVCVCVVSCFHSSDKCYKTRKKSTLDLWIVVNRKKCKRLLNSKPIMRRNYIHTIIYERSFLSCQTFQISNFTSVFTQRTSHMFVCVFQLYVLALVYTFYIMPMFVHHSQACEVICVRHVLWHTQHTQYVFIYFM